MLIVAASLSLPAASFPASAAEETETAPVSRTEPAAPAALPDPSLSETPEKNAAQRLQAGESLLVGGILGGVMGGAMGAGTGCFLGNAVPRWERVYSARSRDAFPVVVSPDGTAVEDGATVPAQPALPASETAPQGD